MTISNPSGRSSLFPVLIRRLLIAWITAASIEFLLGGVRLEALASLNRIQPRRMCLAAGLIFVLLNLLHPFLCRRSAERWMLLGSATVLLSFALTASFSVGLLLGSILILAVLGGYVLLGWEQQDEVLPVRHFHSKIYLVLTILAAVLFTAFVSAWTVGRVRSFCAPTYDFTIFSQMFHSMKTTGLPITTVERDKVLSHFAVHVSPIYYLLLPFYCLVPRPETLQVLQALVLVSAVIPLWKLCRLHGLNPFFRMALSLLLLLYPAYSGGASYDIHENAFLTPLILWMLYGIDRVSVPGTLLPAFLTLMVKEDAAVYVAIAGLWMLLRAMLHRRPAREYLLALILLIGALDWFALVTGYLSEKGDGVMTYRYNNFIYDGSHSLLTVIKAVLLCPAKAVYECMDPEKLPFIALTLLPLFGLPLMTRRYERFLLLIPYVLVNLMSDYQYQHSIFFQYTYGATAFLFYLTVVNLADMKLHRRKVVLLFLAGTISLCSFLTEILPTGLVYPQYCIQYGAHYDQIRQTLDTVPEDASVAATTFYTAYLSNRDTLYDIRYAKQSHVLDCEYVVLTPKKSDDYKRYGSDGFHSLVKILEKNGYTLQTEYKGYVQIYHKG